jgi:hypothetical protein
MCIAIAQCSVLLMLGTDKSNNRRRIIEITKLVCAPHGPPLAARTLSSEFGIQNSELSSRATEFRAFLTKPGCQWNSSESSWTALLRDWFSEIYSACLK